MVPRTAAEIDLKAKARAPGAESRVDTTMLHSVEVNDITDYGVELCLCGSGEGGRSEERCGCVVCSYSCKQQRSSYSSRDQYVIVRLQSCSYDTRHGSSRDLL